MTIENEIQLLLETVNAVDDITTMRAEDTNDKKVYDIDDETWTTADYKAELYALIGQKISEYEKTGGNITLGTVNINTPTPAE